jgi:ankyrin repeat protein
LVQFLNLFIENNLPIKRTNLVSFADYFLQYVKAVFYLGIQSGKTALHIAAQSGHLEVVQWLVNHGLEVDAEDDVRFLFRPSS